MKGLLLTLSVMSKDGPLVQVECFESDSPDLVVHPDVWKEGSGLPHLGLWSVTHRASGGALITSLPNREFAEMAAAWLASQGVDLSLGFKEIRASELAKRITLLLRGPSSDALDGICALADVIHPLHRDQRDALANGCVQ